jgi:hypothetical protein
VARAAHSKAGGASAAQEEEARARRQARSPDGSSAAHGRQAPGRLVGGRVARPGAAAPGGLGRRAAGAGGPQEPEASRRLGQAEDGAGSRRRQDGGDPTRALGRRAAGGARPSGRQALGSVRRRAEAGERRSSMRRRRRGSAQEQAHAKREQRGFKGGERHGLVGPGWRAALEARLSRSPSGLAQPAGSASGCGGAARTHGPGARGRLGRWAVAAARCAGSAEWRAQ